jgi:hypothetical protein
MSFLNELENAVLEEMVRQAPADLFSLEEQLRGVSALSRNNTGAGFYTKLVPKKTTTPVNAKIIGNVFADVKGLNHPMTFILFIRDGVVDTLEGAAVDDSTTDIDFSKVQFEIRSP